MGISHGVLLLVGTCTTPNPHKQLLPSVNQEHVGWVQQVLAQTAFGHQRGFHGASLIAHPIAQKQQTTSQYQSEGTGESLPQNAGLEIIIFLTVKKEKNSM